MQLRGPEPHLYLWTYDEFVRLHEIGIFSDKRVELIEGRVIDMAPVGPRHFIANSKVYEALRAICPPGHFMPPTPVLRLSQSGPLPDVAIVPGRAEDYAGGVPTTAALVVEISDTTLAPDRLDKASMYAKAGIADYWIVNLVDDAVEVHRNPVLDPSQPSGYRYGNVVAYRAGESISPF